MPDMEQNYANHAHFRPLFHYSTLPIFAINAVVYIVMLVRQPSIMAAWTAVVMTALAVFALDNRGSINTLQDRVIRDEMRMRLERVLGGGAKDKIAKLSVDHLIGLRFASDAELPALVDRTLAGEFPNRKAVKLAVKTWQADHIRA